MDSEIWLCLLLVFLVFVFGTAVGFEMNDEALREEIEQYNYIRFDGVHYYPEEVINDD